MPESIYVDSLLSLAKVPVLCSYVMRANTTVGACCLSPVLDVAWLEMLQLRLFGMRLRHVAPRFTGRYRPAELQQICSLALPYPDAK